MLADDLALSALQQQWLRLRCGDWAAATDALLRRLDETRDRAGVQTAADRLSSLLGCFVTFLRRYLPRVAKPASTKPTFSTSGAAQPTLVPGLSIDQAKAIQGEPQRIVEVGNRKIYVYKDLKITFTNGRLTDIE